MQVEPCLRFPYPISLFSSPLHSLPISPFPLTSLSTPPLLPPTIPNPFLLLYSLPFPLQRPVYLGSAITPPAIAGRTRPPNAFLCNSQLKICKFVKLLLFFAWISGAPALGGGAALCPLCLPFEPGHGKKDRP